MSDSKWMLLGASRGLGRAFHDVLRTNLQTHITSTSRQEFECEKWLKMDFSRPEDWPHLVQEIQAERAGHIVYFAGGGPYGFFGEKGFKDHQWAFRVNFEFPAYLLHSVLSQPEKFSDLLQICFLGSAVAEAKPDPSASSYAAAKHALRGLVSSVQLELQQQGLRLDLKLFSPSYMATDLLPKQSWPRQKGLAEDPSFIAKNLLQYLTGDSK